MKIIIFLENNLNGGLDTFCSTLINNWPNKSDNLVLILNSSHPGKFFLKSEIKRKCLFIEHNIFLSWNISKLLFRWFPI